MSAENIYSNFEITAEVWFAKMADGVILDYEAFSFFFGMARAYSHCGALEASVDSMFLCELIIEKSGGFWCPE